MSCNCGSSSGCSCKKGCKCPYDTIVYASAANAYFTTGYVPNGTVYAQIPVLIGGPGGFLDLYKNPPCGGCSKGGCSRCCSSQINAQIFAAAIAGAIKAWTLMPLTSSTGQAYVAYNAIVALLGQYLNYKCGKGSGNKVCSQCCPVTQPGQVLGGFPNIPALNSAWCLSPQGPSEVFLTAFSQIYALLAPISTNQGAINFTAITAIVHYVDVQLCIDPPYDIVFVLAPP